MGKVSVGILSDTHGYLDARIAEKIQACDYVVHAGDIGKSSVLDELKPYSKVIAVRGNNDFGESLISLNSREQLELPGGLLIVEHGHRLGGFPEHDELRWAHAEARIIVYGHTHKRVIDKASEPWVVNPGAAGRERNKGGPSCLVLQASSARWAIEEIVFSDSEAA